MEIDAKSRYNFSALYLDKKDGDYWGIRQPLNLREHSTDMFHQLTQADYKRLDLIADRYYGDVKLWWVIAEVNNISNPLELQVGSVLRIPSYERVMMKVVG